MPKPFLIGIDVEEVAAGKIIRLLDKMPGVIKIHLPLSGSGHAKPVTNGTQPRKMKGGRGAMWTAIQSRLLRTKSLSRADLHKVVDAEQKAIDSAIYYWKQRGLVKSPTPGVYALTAKGAQLEVNK